MTDNGFSYVKNRSLRELLADRGIRHLTTKPYRPRTNGKVERFHQTMAREWAYGLAYRSHHDRNAALPHWLDHYNHAATQLARRPTPDQPRSQRPWVGQLVANDQSGHLAAPVHTDTGSSVALTAGSTMYVQPETPD